MILVVILAGAAVYVTLLVRYLAATHRPTPATTSMTPTKVTKVTPARGDLTDPAASAWTALDDHQLTRLLKESSS